MRIVLAGGWGYGNLGDEVILVSTLKLLLMQYPSADITVLTYRVDNAVKARFPGVDFVSALHAYVDHDASSAFYRFIDGKFGFYGLAQRKGWHYLLERSTRFREQMVGRYREKVQLLIKGSDLFVVGGGGYLNDDWRGNVECNLAQLSLAIQNCVPIAFCGPGLGHFKDRNIRKKLLDAVVAAKMVWVRDIFSANDLSAVRRDLSLIEDVALTEFSSSLGGEKVETLGFIVNKVNDQLFSSLSSSVASTFGGRVRVRLLLSRRWHGDLSALRELERCLREQGVSATIVIPGDCFSLEDEIRSCSMLISENLHGLILAVRNGIQVVAVNDYAEGSPNGRKFVAFMEQLNAQDYVLKSSMSSEMVQNVLVRARALSQDGAERLRKIEFCNSVRRKAEEFFVSLAEEVSRK